MHDETSLALKQAGPDNWHHLIAPTKTFPLTEGTTQFAALAMDSTVGLCRSIATTTALADLAGAALVLSNAIANGALAANAQEAFKEARNTANYLDAISSHTPAFTPTFRTYAYFKRALDTRDTSVLVALLIDVIRVANHLAN